MSEQRRFPDDANSVTEARRYVLDVLADLDLSVAQSIAVMVSELATNAVRHTTSSDFTVTIERTGASIRVEVADRGSGDPVVRAPEPAEPTGRGLQIVRALADDWGVAESPSGPGKTVWFVIAVDADPETRSRAARDSFGPAATST